MSDDKYDTARPKVGAGISSPDQIRNHGWGGFGSAESDVDKLQAQLATAHAEGYAAGVRDAGIACGNSIVEYIKETRPDAGPLKLQMMRVRMEKAAKALIQPDNGKGGDA